MLRREVAASWLRSHDPDRKKNEFFARKKRERDAEQARSNPGLVASYKRALLKT
jgi:hypothetical protein